MSLTVLIVDDEEKARTYLSEILAGHGYHTLTAATLDAAREAIRQDKAHIVLLDVLLGGDYGPDLLKETRHLPDRPPIILVTAHGQIEMAVEAMKDGAHDFITKPVDVERLLSAVHHAAEQVRMQQELAYWREERWRDLPDLVTRSPKMQQILDLGWRAAQTNTPILIYGETGAGKSLLAATIHKNGPRKDKPFIAQNCASIPENTLEAELFGYEKGAYTDAQRRKLGIVELADGGTLFLDEISAMSLRLQAKLLRFLDNHSFRRLGNDEIPEVQVDVHVIAATNRDLKEMIRQQQFRSDLYHRLRVIELVVPPLRERREDIPALAAYLLEKHARRMGRRVSGLTPQALEALYAYPWPGNVRELENAIQRALVMCDGTEIDLPHLPQDVVNSLRTGVA